jgi:hypothetical protein
MEARMATYSTSVAIGAARRRFGPFERILRVVTLMLDTFTESQQIARAAHRRYPFADW